MGLAKTSGSLTVVGTGIKIAAQTSPEALACIERAGKVFFLPADPLTQYWLKQLNASSESLHDLYAVGKERTQTYEEMVERVLHPLREGHDVCFVSYGHPGVFAQPMHEAVRRARAEGYTATMLPAISAEDCLFADLGVDPGQTGCQSFEATDFLVYARTFDPRCALVLWQIGVIAEIGFKKQFEAWSLAGLEALRDRLLEVYDRPHHVYIYDAAQYACCDPTIARVELGRMLETKIGALSTLYVPPKATERPDMEMVRKLGLA